MFSIVQIYSPEGFLIISAALLLIFNSFFAYNLRYRFPILNLEILHQVATISIIALLLATNVSIVSVGFDSFFITTSATQNLKIVLLVVFLSFLLLIWKSFVLQKLNFFEYFIILLLVLAGLLFLISSYNLISIYICLEIQALGFYILASFDRGSVFSSEAGLKYFISSSLISGIFLLGSALIYGSLGTVNLYQLEFLLVNFSDYPVNFLFTYLFFGIFFILVALLFKLVVAPFHFWFPQIYDGAPLSSTIIFSVVPKIALINLFLQFWLAVSEFVPFLETTLFLIGAYSMLFGILKMIKQKKLKKLYIYSSISNMGLLLCAIVNNTVEGAVSAYFFLLIYLIMSFLLWTFLILLIANKTPQLGYPVYLTSLSNLFAQNKILALSICFVFFSLAAIPPFAGFVSKIYIYLVFLKNYKYEMAVFLIYSGTFGVYYYIKFLKIVLFENTKQKISHNVYSTPFFNLESTLYSIYLFLLLFFTIEPTLLFYYCYLLVY